MTTATATPVITQDEVLSQAEFSLLETLDHNIVAQLRFPPGLDRPTLREFVACVRTAGQILHQRCIGNDSETTGWSSLVFISNLHTYRHLSKVCQTSNLPSLAIATENRLLALEASVAMAEAASTQSDLNTTAQTALEVAPSADELTQVEAETLKPETIASAEESEPEPPASADEPQTQSNPKATAENLRQLTLGKLKELATGHNIPGRSAMTKNLEAAHTLLIPKLVGLVSTAELP